MSFHTAALGFLTLGFLTLASAAARADRIELKNGAPFVGTIVEESADRLTLETKNGTMTFDKSQIRKIERDKSPATGSKTGGKPGDKSGDKLGPKPGTGGPGPSGTARTWDGPIPQGPLTDLVARVGPGGVPRREHDLQLLKLANRLDKSTDSLSADERKQALATAIDDEVIFQCALADGILADPYIHDRIVGEYRAEHTAGKIDPQLDFSEEDLQKFYQEHPEEFSEPAEVKVEMLEFPADTPVDQIEALRAAPDTSSSWKDAGWLKKGDPPTHAVTGLNAVVDLQPGQVSPILRNLGVRWLLVRVVERRESKLKPYDDCRDRTRFLLIGKRQEDLGQALHAGLSKPGDGLTEDERLFRAALDAGKHRDPQIHLRIVNEYLAKQGVNESLKNSRSREEAMPELRARMPVEVLLKE